MKTLYMAVIPGRDVYIAWQINGGKVHCVREYCGDLLTWFNVHQEYGNVICIVEKPAKSKAAFEHFAAVKILEDMKWIVAPFNPDNPIKYRGMAVAPSKWRTASNPWTANTPDRQQRRDVKALLRYLKEKEDR